jgi:murein L,D-transpeptidase YafK
MQTASRFIGLWALAALLVGGAASAQSTRASRSTFEKADRIVVVKSKRKLYLMKDGRKLRSFDISLGLDPKGPKRREGDFKTPEGLYYIEAKNPNSSYFLSVQISYPNASDRARAKARGVDPGGQIMIHGLPNDPKYDDKRYLGADWTDGCIAVSDSDMVDIWLMTSVSTPIEILP